MQRCPFCQFILFFFCHGFAYVSRLRNVLVYVAVSFFQGVRPFLSSVCVAVRVIWELFSSMDLPMN